MGLFKRLFHSHLTIECLACKTVIDCNFKQATGDPEFRFVRCPSCTLINCAQHDMPTEVDRRELSAITEQIMNAQLEEADARGRFLTEDECKEVVVTVLKEVGGVWWGFYEENPERE